MAVTDGDCSKCKKVIEESHKTMKCGLCTMVFHSACVGIPVKSFDILSKLKSVHWFCSTCDGGNILDELRDFRDFRSQHAKLTSELSVFADRLQSIETQLQSPSSNSRPLSDEPILTQACVASIIRNEMEAEKRKNNLCVFGLPSSSTLDDKSIFVRLCNEQLGLPKNELEETILEVKRLVNTQNGIAPAARPSPVIIKLPSLPYKNIILKNAPKLKNYHPPNSNLNVFISNEQQLQQKLLRDELSRRRNLGENIVIFRGKIVPKQNPPSHVMSASANNFIPHSSNPPPLFPTSTAPLSNQPIAIDRTLRPRP